MFSGGPDLEQPLLLYLPFQDQRNFYGVALVLVKFHAVGGKTFLRKYSKNKTVVRNLYAFFFRRNLEDKAVAVFANRRPEGKRASISR